MRQKINFLRSMKKDIILYGGANIKTYKRDLETFRIKDDSSKVHKQKDQKHPYKSWKHTQIMHIN